MSSDEETAERLTEIDRKLAELLTTIGHQEPPNHDPTMTRRWQMPIYEHLSHLADSMHLLRNLAQVLTGILEQSQLTLKASQAITAENRESIAHVAEIVLRIEQKSSAFESLVGRVVRKKPFLMRDLYWIDTEGFEVLLGVCAIGDSCWFFAGRETLVRSVLFQGISVLCPYPMVWGLCWAGLAFFSTVAFVSRMASLRSIAAGAAFVFFLIVGGLPIVFTSGADVGTFHHLLFAAVAAWIVSRGPSNAT